MKAIGSRDNPSFKSLRALVDDAKEQRQRGMTLIDGLHLLEVFHQRGGVPKLLLLAEGGQENPQIQDMQRRYPHTDVLLLRDNLFRELSGLATPVGIAAVIDIMEPLPADPEHSCVMLDAIQDAGNVGSILRTAAAAGIRDVFLGHGCAGVWTPKVLRAAQGAHFLLNLVEQADLPVLLQALTLPGVAAVAQGGHSLYETDLPSPCAFLFGNEGAGLSAPLLEVAQCRVTIPLAGQTESLNVAAAAAICLFEALRQRD